MLEKALTSTKSRVLKLTEIYLTTPFHVDMIAPANPWILPVKLRQPKIEKILYMRRLAQRPLSTTSLNLAPLHQAGR